MPRRPATATRSLVAHPSCRLRALPVVLGVVALLTTAGGAGLIILHGRAIVTGHVLAPAGIVLLVCSCLQWRTAWSLWTRPQLAVGAEALFGLVFWRRLFVGAFLSYIAAVIIGPAQHIEYGLLAAVAVWYTVLLLPVTVSLSVFERLHAWSPVWAPRRLGVLVFGSILVLIGAETSLQTFESLGQHGLLFRRGATAPAEQGDLAVLMAKGDIDDDRVTRLTAGPLRVAVLLDERAACGTRNNGYLARVEQALPGVQLVPIALVRPWPCETAGEVAEQLTAARADVVLAMLSVCEDLTRAAPQASWFDWRQFELARLVGVKTPDAGTSPPPKSAADFESFCRILSPQLAACRTPIDENMHQRWEQTFEAVDNLVAACRASNVAVVLVLVPGEFQVNRALCNTLARRSGYKAEQVDVRLPQRKLTSFAADRRLPLIDLLPQLRLCGQSPYERHAATWSDAGHTAAATAIGGWLEGRYGRQLGVSTRLTSSP